VAPEDRVVRQLWICRKALVLTSVDAGARISLRAEAHVLRDLDLGSVATGIAIGSDRGVGLELIGRECVIALGLVRLNLLGNETFRGLALDDDIKNPEPTDEL